MSLMLCFGKYYTVYMRNEYALYNVQYQKYLRGKISLNFDKYTNVHCYFLLVYFIISSEIMLNILIGTHYRHLSKEQHDKFSSFL